jgi:hypothetical protein
MKMRVVKTLSKQMEHAKNGNLYRINSENGYSKVSIDELLRLFNVTLYGKVK